MKDIQVLVVGRGWGKTALAQRWQARDAVVAAAVALIDAPKGQRRLAAEVALREAVRAWRQSAPPKPSLEMA